MMSTPPSRRLPMDTGDWVGFPLLRPLATVAVLSSRNCFRLGPNTTLLLLFRLPSTDTTYWMVLPLLPLLATAVLFP